jgi:hypothetical protein
LYEAAADFFSMQAIFYIDIVVPEYQPTLPIPMKLEEPGPADEGKPRVPSPTDINQTFTSFCTLWAIVSGVLLIYREGLQTVNRVF